MADGGWPRVAGEARTLAALEELRAVLRALEARLAAAGPAPLRAETVTDLIRTLDALARRVLDHETAATRRAGELAAALARLTERLEAQAAAHGAREHAMAARLDLLLDELGRVREVEATVRPPQDPGGLRLVLAAASVAAALSVVGAGVLVAVQPQLLPPFVAALLDDLSLRPGLKPQPRGPASAAARALPVTPPAAGETYAAVAEALARGDAMAIARLTGLAQSGNAQAQLHLASLFETGASSLARDVAAARLWTGRAAEGGDRMAMHNLALFLMQGEGGPRDVAAAAGWFRAAAERGVVDSQYNLAVLYEAGRGVPQNLREAYRWFSIAANAGDVTAREKQVEIEGRLRPTERADLDRETGAFQPGAAIPDLAQVIAPATTLAETQALLARQGYYVGPIDGVASPAFRAAATAYRRDRP